MGIDFFTISLISLAAGGLTTILRILREEGKFTSLFERIEKNKVLGQLLKQLGIDIPKPKESYQERMRKLFMKFEEVQTESNNIVDELEGFVRSKEAAVIDLHNKEKEISTRIAQIQEKPQYVAARNQELLETIAQLQADLTKKQSKEGRRSASRDFILFALGVTLPYILGWIAPHLGLTLPPTP